MRRGQAALEFLTTYGWAFLVILIMIGALAYFGILSPSRFLPERCNVGPEFTCDEYIVDNSDSVLTVRFTNNVGETISNILINRVSWPQEEFAPPVSVTIEPLPTTLPAGAGACVVAFEGGGTSARGGDWIQIRCMFTNAGNLAFPPEGQKMKFDIDLTYLPQGKTYQKPLTAEVYSALQT